MNFDYRQPAEHFDMMNVPILFPPPKPMTVVGFDGCFGVFRRRTKEEGERKTNLAGPNKNKGKDHKRDHLRKLKLKNLVKNRVRPSCVSKDPL